MPRIFPRWPTIILAPGVELSPEERREIYAYVASELSGYWRAARGYAGVQHFLYLRHVPR